MSDPVTNAEVEDVLSSIRRLVSEDKRPVQVAKTEPQKAVFRHTDLKQPEPKKDRLVLTPALRVTAQLSSPCRQACFGKLARWLWPALGVLPFLSDVCTSGWFVAMSVAWPVLGALRHVLPTSGDGLAALRVTAQLSSP